VRSLLRATQNSVATLNGRRRRSAHERTDKAEVTGSSPLKPTASGTHGSRDLLWYRQGSQDRRRCPPAVRGRCRGAPSPVPDWQSLRGSQRWVGGAAIPPPTPPASMSDRVRRGGSRLLSAPVPAGRGR